MTTLIAAVGDIHANSTVAVCPPRFTLDDGGDYVASKAQRWLWRRWCDYWQAVGDMKAEKGATVYALFNGELADDLSHSSTQLITKNPASMLKLAIAVLEPALDVADHVIVTRGTEAHSGRGSSMDEAIAEDIGAIPDSDGNRSHYVYRAVFDGVRVHAQHHAITASQRTHTRTQAAGRQAYELQARYLRMAMPPPHVALFSHTHRPNDSGDGSSGDGYFTRALTLPAWQLQTAFAHRIAAGWEPCGGAIVEIVGQQAYRIHKEYYQWPIEKWRSPITS